MIIYSYDYLFSIGIMNSLTMIQQLHFSLKEIENLIENLIYSILILLNKTKNEKYERKNRKTAEFDFCHFLC